MAQRRIIFLAVLICFLLLILAVKLFSLQILNVSYYRQEAKTRSTTIELIPAPRGKILERNNLVLVQDSLSFDLYLIPAQVSDSTITHLSRLLKIPTDQIKNQLNAIEMNINKLIENKSPREQRKILRQQRRREYKIRTNINLDQAIEIETNPQDFVGVVVREKVRREYLFGNLACHLLGYLSAITKDEYDILLKNGFFRQYLPKEIDQDIYDMLVKQGVFLDELLARTGVEKQFDHLLRGICGIRLMEHDFVGRVKKELSRIPPQPGKDLVLTIDFNLQKQAEALLKGKVGSIIIMDVTNGEILAIASAPDFDPNSLQKPVKEDTIKYLFDNPQKPLLNRPVAGQYAPGSIFKIVTATAGLEMKKISPDTKFNCLGYFSSSSTHFKCWITEYNRTHGPTGVVDGLKYSCNIFFFNVGKAINSEALVEWARKYGFGKKTGISLPGEQPGLVPDPSWKITRFKEKWFLYDTLNFSIGQGDLMVTPLQIVRFMAAVANGGRLLVPRITKTFPENENPLLETIEISPKVLSIIREGLHAVVHHPEGTAYKSGLAAYPIAGKTSTAEVSGNIVKHLPHAWFAGYLPYDKPRIALVVMIEHGGKGTEVAAPLAAKLMPEIMNYLQASSK